MLHRYRNLLLVVLLFAGAIGTELPGVIDCQMYFLPYAPTTLQAVKGTKPTVYLKTGEAELRPIDSYAAFLAMGIPFENIQTMPDVALSAHTISEPVSRYITAGDDVFTLINGTRYRTARPASDASTVPPEILSALPLAPCDAPHDTVPDTAPVEIQQHFPEIPPPSPLTDYNAWLKHFPRPKTDTGRCMHYLQTPTGDPYDDQIHIERMRQMGVRWALVNYVEREQLFQLAPQFKAADITVVWRPFVRPVEVYDHWHDDVLYLRTLGLAPYMQIYNEPSLQAEWDGEIQQDVYLDNFVEAAQQVYEAGGYVGLQNVDVGWTRAVLQRIKAEEMQSIYNRLYFIPHSYGGNYPPEHQRDTQGVLGWQPYADVFTEEIGFVPMFFIGEGGWQIGNAYDPFLEPVTPEQHRDYHVAAFEWFRTGELSSGEPLPDYLFAFCPWLLAGRFDSYAWFDHPDGNRSLTVDAVMQMPTFERRFSWDQTR